MEELETPSHLKTIISKLPFKLRHRWRTISCDVQDESKRPAKFKDLVEFVERQSRVLLDPFFGDIQDVTDGKGFLKSTKRSAPQRPPFQPASRGSSFAPAVATMSEKREVEESQQNKAKPLKQQELKAHTSPAHPLAEPCLYCSKDHSLESCAVLKHKANKEKVDFMKSKGLCFGSFGKGHMSTKCKNGMTLSDWPSKPPKLLHIEKKKGVEQECWKIRKMEKQQRSHGVSCP